MITCPNCNHQNPDGAVQCEACYTPLPSKMACPSCGANIQSDASFCGQCGADLRSVSALAPRAPGPSAPVPNTPAAVSSEPPPPLPVPPPPSELTEADWAAASLEPDSSASQGVATSEGALPDLVPPDPLVEPEPILPPPPLPTGTMAASSADPTNGPAINGPTTNGPATNGPASSESVAPQPSEPFSTPNTATPPPEPPSASSLTPSVSSPSAAAPPPPQTRLQRNTARLLHVQTDAVLELPDNVSPIRIGKPNDRVPPDIDVSGFPESEIVSRVHANIRVEGDIYYIEDVGSSNGTYVNNMPLPYGNRHRLRPGDRVALGKGDKVSFIFQFA